MNCQIISINSDTLTLEIISTLINSNLSIYQAIEIDKTQYLDANSKLADKKYQKSFGKVIEISSKYIKLKLLKSELFILGKIVKLNAINQEAIFLPLILNKVIVFGEKTEIDSEQIFEFIPTVLVDQEVAQGQKIGYVNAKTIHKQNFRCWILAHKSGKVSKIELGDYKIGQQIAIIDKSNILLGSQYKKTKAANVLLKNNINPKTISISKNPEIDLKLQTGQYNLILDTNKKFLNIAPLQSDELGNTIFIFVTQDKDFVASSNLKSITYFDKYNLGQALGESITDLALNICEIGYDVVVVTQKSLYLNCIGQYKTINGENVHITSILQDCYQDSVINRFDHVAVIN